MTSAEESSAPPSVPEAEVGSPSKVRLSGIDAARGVALLGMMAVHALLVADAQGDPTASYWIAAGRSAALFAVLAGVGISLTTGRARAGWDRRGGGAAASLVARALALAVIGLLLGYTDSEFATVILVYYSALFLMAIPLLFAPTRVLVGIGTATALFMPVVSHLLRSEGLPVLDSHPSPTSLLEPGVLVVDVLLTGTFPALPWIAYLCAGLVIGRLRLSRPLVARRLFATGLAMGIGAKLVSLLLLGPLGGSDRITAAATGNGMTADEVSDILAFGGDGITPTDTWWWLATAAPHTSTPVDLIHTIGTAAAVIGFFLIVTDTAPEAFGDRVATFLTPLRAAGSMTLTLYAAHVLFLNSPLDVFGAITGYVVQVLVALVFATLWSQARGSGPLESVVTNVSKRARAAVTTRGAH